MHIASLIDAACDGSVQCKANVIHVVCNKQVETVRPDCNDHRQGASRNSTDKAHHSLWFTMHYAATDVETRLWHIRDTRDCCYHQQQQHAVRCAINLCKSEGRFQTYLAAKEGPFSWRPARHVAA